MAMERETIPALREALLAWFGREGRQFPWRATRDPFAVLIAEKLLQQTAAAERTVAAYRAVLACFPAPAALAAAEPAVLQALVAPLGLHYRARELQALGRALVDEHGGAVPDTLEGLLALPGVGDYAARAVLSFCFGQDVAVVDTNVARLLHRLHGLTTPLPPNPARSASLRRLAQEMLLAGRARSFNFAVLDLCASVCLPHAPRCDACPIRPFCACGSRAGEGQRQLLGGS